MTRPLAAAFLVLLFIAGIAAGVFIDRLFLLEPRGAGLGPPGRAGPPPPEMFLRALQSELSLTAEQRAQIEEILTQAQASAHAALERARPELDLARRQTSEKILAVLTPEQRAIFERLERERPPLPFGPPPGGPPGGGPPGGPPGRGPPPFGPPPGGPPSGGPPDGPR